MRCFAAHILAATLVVGLRQRSVGADDRAICLDGNTAPDNAITACGHLIAVNNGADRDLAAYHNQRAVAWLRKGKFDQALEDLNISVGLDPTDATAFANRGYAFDGKGELDRAMADFSESIRLGNNQPHVFNQRGVLWSNGPCLFPLVHDVARTSALRT